MQLYGKAQPNPQREVEIVKLGSINGNAGKKIWIFGVERPSGLWDCFLDTLELFMFNPLLNLSFKVVIPLFTVLLY